MIPLGTGTKAACWPPARQKDPGDLLDLMSPLINISDHQAGCPQCAQGSQKLSPDARFKKLWRASVERCEGYRQWKHETKHLGTSSGPDAGLLVKLDSFPSVYKVAMAEMVMMVQTS